jgi:hypothetical protein
LIQDETVDIAFIDAIHTPKAVLLQYDILKPMMKSGGFILFDDIVFSEAMKACWEKIASSSAVTGSAIVAHRVGIIELSGA